jgi:uncharacterized protein YndB with AHSA1/START domain
MKKGVSMQTSQQKTGQSSQHKNSTPQSRLLEVTREFEVPVSRLFEAFKTSDAIQKWWWPNGLSVDRINYDFRRGGQFFITMKGSQSGAGMTGQFEEIIENERIVMSDKFSDAGGRAISAKEAKMPGAWPDTVYITFDFQDAGANKSRVSLSQEGIPNEMQKDCAQGWEQMFDKLEKHLGSRKQ